MKKIIVLTLLFVNITTNAQEINWLTFNEALIAQEKKPKKIIIDAYTDWCGWCKKMDNDTFSNLDVIEYINKNFYAVKFNAEGNETVILKGKTYSNPQYIPNKKGRNYSHQLSSYFSVRGFPSMVFLDKKANLMAVEPGYKAPDGMLQLLKLYASKK